MMRNFAHYMQVMNIIELVERVGTLENELNKGPWSFVKGGVNIYMLMLPMCGRDSRYMK